MKKTITFSLFALAIFALGVFNCTHKKLRASADESGDDSAYQRSIKNSADELYKKGKSVFRFETFGDEVFWTDKLKIHKAIADDKHGGNGKGLSPKEALAAGL